jgi:putative transposase
MSQGHNHLNHATWECKYHVVFTPKYRKKVLFGQIRRHLGTVFHELARRKECQIEEGHLMPDHVHILMLIPPKCSVAEVIGYLKGKSSIWVAQNVERKARNFLAFSTMLSLRASNTAKCISSWKTLLERYRPSPAPQCIILLNQIIDFAVQAILR